MIEIYETVEFFNTFVVGAVIAPRVVVAVIAPRVVGAVIAARVGADSTEGGGVP